MDQAHLVEGLDRVTRALGGVPARWLFDRMATVCHPGSGRVTASFAAVAKHYGAGVDIWPPRRGNRKGVVEKAIHGAAQRWWRTLPDDVTVEAAQASLDAFCTAVIDARPRTIDGVRALDHDEAEPEPTCWCCGRHYPEERLVRLGTHREAGVCFQCAKFLHRRAREQHDVVRGNRGFAARGRVVFKNGRDIVVRHGWQNGRFSGPILRWIERFTP